VVVVATAITSRGGLPAAFGVFFLYLLGLGRRIWQRFNSVYGFTVASAPDGIRIRRGLLNKVSETIPVRRIQAVRQEEPLLWRFMGWCRLDVVLARIPGRESGSGGAAVRKALLPVGSLSTSEDLRGLVIRSVGFTPSPPPRRALFKAPLSYHFLAAGHDDTYAIAVTGRIRKSTCWVPLEKVQSVRLVQGPAQRRLRLATVHVDVAGRRVQAEFQDRDMDEARTLVVELAALSRQARHYVTAEPQPTTALSPSSPAGGWYPDPTGRHRHRYWDGQKWTGHVHDDGEATTVDPIGI
jgi:putative membrane protein